MGTCTITLKVPPFFSTTNLDDYEDFAVYSGQLDSSGSCFTTFNTSTLLPLNLPVENTVLFEASVVSSATQEVQKGTIEIPIEVIDDATRKVERES